MKALCGSRSMVHMRTVNSAATPDRESGMGHQVAYLAAVDGKHRGNKINFELTSSANIRRLLIAAAVLFAASASTSPVHAQAGGPYAGMAGNWAGGGTVTLDDGSRERLRCRASYGGCRRANDHDPDLRQRRLQVPAQCQCGRSGRRGVRQLDRDQPQHQRHACRAAAPAAAISTWSPAPPASTPTSRCVPPATSSRSICAPTASSGPPRSRCRASAVNARSPSSVWARRAGLRFASWFLPRAAPAPC